MEGSDVACEARATVAQVGESDRADTESCQSPRTGGSRVRNDAADGTSLSPIPRSNVGNLFDPLKIACLGVVTLGSQAHPSLACPFRRTERADYHGSVNGWGGADHDIHSYLHTVGDRWPRPRHHAVATGVYVDRTPGPHDGRPARWVMGRGESRRAESPRFYATARLPNTIPTATACPPGMPLSQVPDL